MNNNNSNDLTLTKYDRQRANLHDVGLFTRPSTIKNRETFTGRAETFVVDTCRHESGDYIFVECVDESATVTRLVLPPKVADAIAAQRESLTKKRRSAAAVARAKTLTDDQKREIRERLAKARGKRGKKTARR